MRIARFAAAPVVAACLLVLTAPAPTQGASPAQLYDAGATFAEFLAGANRRRAAWHDHYDNGAPSDAAVTRALAIGRPAKLLVIAEDWCGDSVNTIPYLARLVERVDGLEMRVIDSTVGRKLMERHRTLDGRASTPTVVLLDADGNEVGHWVERPSNLQDWFLTNQSILPNAELYDQKYAWYATDRGASTVAEITELLMSGLADASYTLVPRSSGTEALLQAVYPVDGETIWVSGHDGTWARSIDGGATWRSGVVAGAEQLQFRDVHALDADTAWLLSAGSGDLSRIYRTDDAGASWTLQFRNAEPTGFFDCFDFWDADRGIAFSDSIDGQMYLLRTADGGSRWERVPPDSLPAALDGEGSFAASGTCVTVGPNDRAWIATGAGVTARVLMTRDAGVSWSVVDTPAVAGESSGLASIGFRNALHGIALGGDIAAPDQRTDNVIVTRDGGASWTLGGRPTFTGAVYGSAWVPGSGTVVAVGPGGIDASADGGATWRSLGTTSHWAVGFGATGTGWAVGPAGRITEIRAAAPGAANPASQVASPPTTITPERLVERIESKEPLLILDVRSAEEFAAGHVPGAINIPHTEIGEQLDLIRRAGDVDVVVYCRSGRRAGLAEEVLRGAGLARILDLDGHMLGWIGRGLAVER